MHCVVVHVLTTSIGAELNTHTIANVAMHFLPLSAK